MKQSWSDYYFVYTLHSSSVSNFPTCIFFKHVVGTLIGVNIWQKYLPNFVVFSMGFHHQLLIFMRFWKFCVYKHSYCFVGISLWGVKTSFFFFFFKKKMCFLFFFSIFSKVFVKTNCTIRDYQMLPLGKFNTWCELEGGVSTLPPHQLSLPSPVR